MMSCKTACLVLLSLTAAAGGLSGCGQAGPETKEAAAYDSSALGYEKTPEVTSVAVTAAGELLVTGTAAAEGRVRLTSITGQAYGVTAGKDGRFQASLPQTPGGSLYDLSMEQQGRLMKAQGRLFVPPATRIDEPPRAVFLRMGAPGLPLWPQAPLLALADYDAGGALSVSGRAESDALIEIDLNGQKAAEVRSGADGIYSVLIPLEASAIGQRLVVGARSRQSYETHPLILRAPRPAASAGIENGVWYVDRPLTGGGTQVTVLF
ncbi:hypothetical protein PQU92_13545 [Asticcacaulis sp. BYS171W]|uniref:Carboxypeptidase regulatory-like domain-containing protein n=1 Tax=Asticcacaulis aquaticus TaxID=2984212 RepID=A0ABT5HWJ7_9CAUL|nr:hypothetical protein [Asticcacaulis aquaticus]MDC7684308.1 hypothetical protein [Asticcacaulis aquaticus]